MRRGSNPAKSASQLAAFRRHHVIIPVYIPELSGYFAQLPEILGLCLDSLEATAGDSVDVTVVANGCCPEVVEQLQARSLSQLVMNARNLGKVDALASVARGSYAEIITMADADVLFLPGWQQAVEQLFSTFPECGMVTPFPGVDIEWFATSATILGAWPRLKRRDLVPASDLADFAASIDQPEFFAKASPPLVVEREGVQACVGCRHFVASWRRGILAGMPAEPSRVAIVQDSERRWIDEPADRLGYWRLSTTRAFVRHLGNSPAPWMHECLTAMEPVLSAQALPLAPLRRRLVSHLPYPLRTKACGLLRRLLG